MKYCSSGIPNFDEILGGGLPKPSLILIAGTAGVGKTTLVLQSISKAAENGEKVIYMPLTSQSAAKLDDYLHSYTFFNEDVMVHPIDRSSAEKDPLTTLLDMGNILASFNPDRVVVNPLTTMGFGFSPQEKRRFFYSFDAMLQDWSAQTLITGELSRNEIHTSILPHIADGVIYLDRKKVGNKQIRKLEIMKMRGTADTQNGSPASYEFKIGPEGIIIFPKLDSEITDIAIKSEKLSTGIYGLDAMMHGGIPRQSTVLVVGGAGLGKTTIGLQFIVAGLRLGEPGVIAVFDEREDQLIYEAAQLGWDLKVFIDNGLLRIIYSYPHNMSPDEHNLKIKSAIEEIKAKRLLFDGVYNLESVIPDPVELREHMRRLTDFLKYRGITVILTNEVSEFFSLEKMPEYEMSSIADDIISLHFLEEHNRVDRVISILKLRGSDYDPTIRKYTIRDNGIEVIQKELPVY